MPSSRTFHYYQNKNDKKLEKYQVKFSSMKFFFSSVSRISIVHEYLRDKDLLAQMLHLIYHRFDTTPVLSQCGSSCMIANNDIK